MSKMFKNEIGEIEATLVSDLVATVLADESVQKLLEADTLSSQAEAYFADSDRMFKLQADKRAAVEVLGKELKELQAAQAKIVTKMRQREDLLVNQAMLQPDAVNVKAQYKGEFKTELRLSARKMLYNKDERYYRSWLKEGYENEERMSAILGETDELNKVADQAKADGDTLAAKGRELAEEAKKAHDEYKSKKA